MSETERDVPMPLEYSARAWLRNSLRAMADEARENSSRLRKRRVSGEHKKAHEQLAEVYCEIVRTIALELAQLEEAGTLEREPLFDDYTEDD